jgi:hypothetical protein
MIEDWLGNQGTKEYFQRDAVMKSREKSHPEEKLDEATLLPIQGEKLK